VSGAIPQHRWSNLKTLMGGRRVVHFRATPFRLQPSICFWPFRLLAGLLLPMDKSRFVTPLQEPAHHLAMRSGQHERLHGGFGCPHRTSPEGTVSVTKQGHSEVTLRIPGLSGCAKGVENKGQKVSPPPNTQSRNGNHSHDANYILRRLTSDLIRQISDTGNVSSVPGFLFSRTAQLSLGHIESTMRYLKP
jgi:hypothetical protein